MNRIFSRYLHRNGVQRALVDAGMIVLAMFALVLAIPEARTMIQDPGSHGLTLAAGIFFVNTATGFYGTRANRSFSESFLRACISLAFALPLTYLILSLTVQDMGNQSAVRFAAMAGVAAVILHRGYEVAASASKAGGRSRILILGSGEAARVVGNTLQAADPNAQIVGYFAGPNERDPAVPTKDLLPAGRALMQTVREHKVDEVIVALTERRSGSTPLRELLDCKLMASLSTTSTRISRSAWARSASITFTPVGSSSATASTKGCCAQPSSACSTSSVPLFCWWSPLP
jgi:FlaA1/EpsC-like NDP-sugar epimerase